MIIAIDASRANKAQKTGVEWYAFHIIEQLKSLIDSSVRVILYTDAPLQGSLAQLPKNWEVKMLRWPPKRLWTQLRLSMQMLVDRPDVLFIPAHVAPCIHPKKTVVTIHDIAGVRFPEVYSAFERWYSIFSAKRAMRKVSDVVVPTEYTKQEILDVFGEGAAAMHVIGHGYDTGYAKEKPKPSSYGTYFLSISRIEHKKNTIGIVKAFELYAKNHVDVSLVLAGKPGYGYDEVVQAITKSDVKKRIHMLGYIPQQKAYALMQHAEAFVYPSLYEGFGMPILEAFAAKTPVITSSTTSTAEVAGDAALLVNPTNITAIAAAMEQVSKEREALTTKGADRLKDFSWKKAAKEYANIFQKK
ncbi:MAG: glycosyltransferase family 4 protein [Candidatus Magasanikbacteria bacterium]|jgi:glycosyltransferase involved in cell wall biosynthesis|nr:glycosyltransferase family 4 protein [Candidatus Magasanikbacteria bacterium]